MKRIICRLYQEQLSSIWAIYGMCQLRIKGSTSTYPTSPARCASCIYQFRWIGSLVCMSLVKSELYIPYSVWPKYWRYLNLVNGQDRSWQLGPSAKWCSAHLTTIQSNLGHYANHFAIETRVQGHHVSKTFCQHIFRNVSAFHCPHTVRKKKKTGLVT